MPHTPKAGQETVGHARCQGISGNINKCSEQTAFQALAAKGPDMRGERRVLFSMSADTAWLSSRLNTGCQCSMNSLSSTDTS